jgi:hypothetical protein
MPGPTERLPERKAEILVEGAKIKFVLNARNEVQILGNRKGLSALAAICSGLSESTASAPASASGSIWAGK